MTRNQAGDAVCRQSLFTLALIVAALCLHEPAASAQGAPLEVQKQAVARIDAAVDQFRRTGEFASAAPLLSQAALELAASNQRLQASRDWGSLAYGLIKQGHIYRMQGQWATAIALYEQAEAAARQAGHREHESDALSWRALAAVSGGQVGRAFDEARRSVQVAETIQNPSVLVRALDVLATVQIAQRDLAGAADTVDREVALVAALNDPLAAYYAYLNRADVQLKVAERCDFRRVFEACYSALDRAGADLQLARSAIANLGYRGLEQSLSGFVDNLAQRRALIASVEKTQATVRNASLFNAQRAQDVLVTERFLAPPGAAPPQLAALEEEMRRARAAAGGFAASTQARADYVEGLFREMRGDNDAALDFFLRAAAALENDRQALRDERSRGTFLEDRITIYYAAIQQLLERKRYDEAFDLFERSRSRALADLLASRGPALRTPREQQLFSGLMLMRTRIADAQGRAFELAAGRAPDSEPQLAALQARIRTLEGEYDQALARIAAEAPRLTTLVSAPAVRLQDLQRALADDGAELVQYLVLEHAVLLWHVTPESVTVLNVFLPRTEVAAKVAALRRGLTDRNGTFDTTAARQLYLYLFAPVASRIRSDRLVIIPHDDLHYIPFQALQAPDGTFLGERADISYAPSATVLLAMRRSSGIAGGRLLAVADPAIEAAPGEVGFIAQDFARPRIVSDRLAGEDEVRAAIRDHDVVHLAVHGKFDAAEPMLSYLALGRGGSDDGRLTAAEMFGLPLDGNRLVVLSACETGRAEATHGNELMGMARALIFAGAGALVLSHWEVDSAATAEWMKVFYAEAAKRPLAEAAREALRRLKNRPEYQHPYYWAAFTMIGR